MKYDVSMRSGPRLQVREMKIFSVFFPTSSFYGNLLISSCDLDVILNFLFLGGESGVSIYQINRTVRQPYSFAYDSSLQPYPTDGRLGSTLFERAL